MAQKLKNKLISVAYLLNRATIRACLKGTATRFLR